MLNRRAFVQSLGIGTVGTLSLLETPAAAAAARAAKRGAPRRHSRRRDPDRQQRESQRSDGFRHRCARSRRRSKAIATPAPSRRSSSSRSPRPTASPPNESCCRAARETCCAPRCAPSRRKTARWSPARRATSSRCASPSRPACRCTRCRSTGDLKLDLDAMLAKSGGSGLVYICNPNNPTSTIVPSADVKRLIEQVAKSSPATTVLVDEAYFEYADDPGVRDADPARRRVSVGGHRAHLLEDSRHGGHARRLRHRAGEDARRDARAALSVGHQRHELSPPRPPRCRDTAAMQRNQLLNRQTRALTVAAFEKAGYTVAASQANFVMVDVRRDVRAFIDAVPRGRASTSAVRFRRSPTGRASPSARSRRWTARCRFMLDVLKTPATSSASTQPLPAIYALLVLRPRTMALTRRLFLERLDRHRRRRA